MKVGERALVKCDPKSAYGRKGMPPHIPPEATLKFDIELLGVTPKP
jgi:FKBP-type peptidyl-prolyl cis-trans isomerase